MLTPKTGLGAGILHKNSVALAQRGPWRFAAVTWGDAVEGPADGEPTSPQHKARCATCEVCSAAIVNIVDLRNASGDRVTVGIDCAETLLDNQAKLKLKAAIAPHEKAKREAAKARKLARVAAVNVVKYATELTALDRLATLPDHCFARMFGHDVAKTLRSGKTANLTEKQIALIGKLTAEYRSELK
jgi:hypothetical protein